MFYFLRCSAASFLFCLFGYLAPALNSIKAVVSEDNDGIKEYLTYWVVLSVTSFLAWLLTFLRLVHIPDFPEAKVACVLWLTLPRFQGAYRIYVLLLKWSYDKYEADIDDHVSVLTGKLRSTLWSKLKMVFFVLFFSNNDYLMRGAGSLGSFDLLSGLADVASGKWAFGSEEDPASHSRMGGTDGNGGGNRGGNGEERVTLLTSPQPGLGSTFWTSPEDKKSAKERFRARMLAELGDLLREGVFIQSCLVPALGAYDSSRVVVSRLLLRGDSLYLQSTEQDSPRSSPESQAGGEDSAGESPPRGVRVPLSSLAAVERRRDPHRPDQDVVILRAAASPGSFDSLYLHAEDSGEADMLTHGFKQMIHHVQGRMRVVG